MALAAGASCGCLRAYLWTQGGGGPLRDFRQEGDIVAFASLKDYRLQQGDCFDAEPGLWGEPVGLDPNLLAALPGAAEVDVATVGTLATKCFQTSRQKYALFKDAATSGRCRSATLES